MILNKICALTKAHILLLFNIKIVCMENYSDGLEKLITNRISVLSEEELLKNKEGLTQKIREAFLKLCQRSKEAGFAFSSFPVMYKEEISNLRYWLEDRATYLMNYRYRLQDRATSNYKDFCAYYERYLCWRYIFLVVILCPTVLAREKVYDYWQYCVKNHVF